MGIETEEKAEYFNTEEIQQIIQKSVHKGYAIASKLMEQLIDNAPMSQIEVIAQTMATLSCLRTSSLLTFYEEGLPIELVHSIEESVFRSTAAIGASGFNLKKEVAEKLFKLKDLDIKALPQDA